MTVPAAKATTSSKKAKKATTFPTNLAEAKLSDLDPSVANFTDFVRRISIAQGIDPATVQVQSDYSVLDHLSAVNAVRMLNTYLSVVEERRKTDSPNNIRLSKIARCFVNTDEEELDESLSNLKTAKVFTDDTGEGTPFDLDTLKDLSLNEELTKKLFDSLNRAMTEAPHEMRVNKAKEARV